MGRQSFPGSVGGFVGAGLLLLLAFSAGTPLHGQDDSFTLKRVSVASDGTPGNNASHSPATSHDGRFIAFYSAASNLVPGDDNRNDDIFLAANPLFQPSSPPRAATGAAAAEARRAAATAMPTPRGTPASGAAPSATPSSESAGGGCSPLAGATVFADVGWLILGLVGLQLGLMRRRRR